jgi:hypothetical protein
MLRDVVSLMPVISSVKVWMLPWTALLGRRSYNMGDGKHTLGISAVDFERLEVVNLCRYY